MYIIKFQKFRSLYQFYATYFSEEIVGNTALLCTRVEFKQQVFALSFPCFTNKWVQQKEVIKP